MIGFIASFILFSISALFIIKGANDMKKVYLIIYKDPWTHEGCSDFDGQCCGNGDTTEIKAIFDSSEKAYEYIANIEFPYDRKDFGVEEMEVK